MLPSPTCPNATMRMPGKRSASARSALAMSSGTRLTGTETSCLIEAPSSFCASIKHDVSVPVSRVPELIANADRALAERFPGIRIVAFGHVGDGNIHYNCSKAERQDARAFFAEAPQVNHVVYETVRALGGSISAEHGLGALKRDEITRYKSALELDLMRSVKRTLDPHGLMNPGKVL